MKIYTRGGDEGETSLLGGSRVQKNDPRIDAYGTIDELSAFIGAARSSLRDSAGETDAELRSIQDDLFELGAQLACDVDREGFAGVAPRRVEALERAIDGMESALTPLTNFILPGGSNAAAMLHVSRTVARRAERLIVPLVRQRSSLAGALRYLNRLSDYLFVAARHVNRLEDVEDVPWKRG